MILSEYKFVFVHIPKTGGSSIESVFGYNLWDKNAFADNYYNLDLALGFCPKRKKYLQHLTMNEIESFAKNKIDGYFRFAFVRNPWSRAVSDYLFYTRGQTASFKDFLLTPNDRISNNVKIDPSHLIEQHRFIYNENNNLMVDFVGKFESLQEDFNIICDQINYPRTKLPHNNKSLHNGSYKSYYNQETYDIVNQKFAKDIKLFNYNFNSLI